MSKIERESIALAKFLGKEIHRKHIKNEAQLRKEIVKLRDAVLIWTYETRELETLHSKLARAGHK